LEKASRWRENNYPLEHLLWLCFRWFNKVYFKKHLAARKPILYLHPAIEKTRSVLRESFTKRNVKSEEIFERKLEAKYLPLIFALPFKKTRLFFKRKCKS
jgi:hypothetical protein